MWLYLVLLLSSALVPLILSFESRLRFYTQLKYLIPALLLAGAVFIVFDVYMTKAGVWGFNQHYHLNINLLGLPLEEWLFFMVIPYASVFIHDSFVLYYPKFRLPDKLSSGMGIVLLTALLVLSVVNWDKSYSVYIFLTGAIVIILSFFDNAKTINHFYITYLIILIPFFIVNAILTGSLIDNEVVWYNNKENLSIRILTIPVEDFVYGFSLVLLVLLIRSFFKNFFNDSEKALK